MSNRNPRGRRVPAANVGAPVSQPAPTPVDAPAMVATPPVAAPVPVADDDGVPSSISSLLANVNANQPRIEDLLKRIDLGNYVEGLEASELLGMTWQGLADLRPRFLNAPKTDATEMVLRQAIDRADPNTSPLVCEEVANAIKLACAASSEEVWADARKYADVPTRYDAAHKRHVKPADARKMLDDKFAELNGANDLSGQLKQARIKQAIDAIDDRDALVKLQKALNSMRSKGTGRRAVFTMLKLCQPVIEANSKPNERGGSYVKWATKAKAAYENWMQKTLASKDATIITPEKVQEVVTDALTTAMQTEKGEKLGDAKVELTPAQRIDKLWDLIATCKKKEVISENAATQLTDVLRAHKYLRSDATPEAELDVTTSSTGRKRADTGATGTVNPPVEVVQPVEQPVQRVVPAAAMSVEEAAAKLAAA